MYAEIDLTTVRSIRDLHDYSAPSCGCAMWSRRSKRCRPRWRIPAVRRRSSFPATGRSRASCVDYVNKLIETVVIAGEKNPKSP